MNLKEAVDQLAAIGDADAIMVHLAEELDLDLVERPSASQCPVALYLSMQTEIPITVCPRRASPNWGRLEYCVDLPENIQEFIRRFDDKRYDDAFGLTWEPPK